MDLQRIVIDVPARTVAKVLVLALLFTAAVDVIVQVQQVLTWIGISLFLAIVLTPAVRVASRHLPRTLAVLAVFLVVLALLAAFLAMLIIPISTQVDNLAKAAPGYIHNLERNSRIRDLNQRYDVVTKAQQQVTKLPSKVFGAAGAIVSGLTAAVTILFLTLFLMLELPKLSEALLSLTSPPTASRIRRVVADVERTVGGYVAGNLIISVIAGITVGVSLWLLGVPYALALGLLMAFFDLVPLVGATIGALAAIGVAFATQGVTAGVIMIVVNIVYQQVENHVLQPLVYRRTVQLSSFLIIVSVLMGAALLGVLGALIAIPVAGAIQVVLRDVMAERAARAASAPSS